MCMRATFFPLFWKFWGPQRGGGGPDPQDLTTLILGGNTQDIEAAFRREGHILCFTMIKNVPMAGGYLSIISRNCHEHVLISTKI